LCIWFTCDHSWLIVIIPPSLLHCPCASALSLGLVGMCFCIPVQLGSL
jgi:hypothetical protein